MKYKTVRIMIAKGKARLLYTVSMLMLPLISWAQNNSGNTVNRVNVDDVIPMLMRSDDVRVMYGVPPVYDNPTRDTVPAFDIRSNGMSLMYGPPPVNMNTVSSRAIPLVVLDGEIAECDSAVLAKFNFNRDIYFRGNLSELLGINARSIKCVRNLMQSSATQIWGMRGANGVVEVYTRKYYRKNRKRLSGAYSKVLNGKPVMYL